MVVHLNYIINWKRKIIKKDNKKIDSFNISKDILSFINFLLFFE